MKVYETDDVKVFWDSTKCMHAAECTSRYPEVFNIERKPWIDITKADAKKLMEVIDCCPSGALSYEAKDNAGPEAEPENTVTVRVSESGPYLVMGKCRVLSCQGEELQTGKTFALCRCGHSCTMPFCDGTHKRIAYREPPQKKLP